MQCVNTLCDRVIMGEALHMFHGAALDPLSASYEGYSFCSVECAIVHMGANQPLVADAHDVPVAPVRLAVVPMRGDDDAG